MLAAMSDYLYIWQVPLVLVFLAVWLVVGGRTLLGGLKKIDYGRRKHLKQGRCVLVSILAGLVGAAAGGIVGGIIYQVGDVKAVDLRILAIAAGAVVALCVFVVVTYTMLELSFVQAIRVVGKPLLVIAVAGAIVGTGAILPAYFIKLAKLRQQAGQEKLERIFRGIASDFKTRFGRSPASLAELIEQNYVSEQDLRYTDSPAGRRDFFYAPSEILPRGTKGAPILACDLLRNHGGKGRVRLLANGECNWLSEKQFQEELAEPRNAAFAEALRKAESQ